MKALLPFGLALTALLLPLGCSGKPVGVVSGPVTPPPADFRLSNGLEVMVRPVGGTAEAALVVLYGVGEGLDPAGKSGLAHLAEHCYLTAACPGKRERSFEELVSLYPAGTNAQTGRDYTVFAAVFPARSLAAELDDAAARMKSPSVTPADLDREVPRLNEELGNMYGGLPRLAALNLAKAQVCPAQQPGGRRGGVEAEVSALTAADVQGYLDRYCKPANAVLVIAGAVSPAEVRKMVEDRFGALPPGAKAPAVPGPGAGPGPERAAAGPRSPRAGAGGGGGCAAVAVRSPRPADPDYAAFLVAAARLFERSTAQGNPLFQVHCAVLDDPEALAVERDLARGETPEQAWAAIDRFVAEALAPPLGPPDRLRARNAFGFLLGLIPVPDEILKQNLYGVAFSMAMRRKLGLDPATLNAALDNLDEARFRAVLSRFSGERQGRAAAGPTAPGRPPAGR